MQAQEPSLITNDAPEAPASSQQEWRTILAHYWQTSLAILPLFLLTRFLLVVLTYFGGILFTVPNNSSFQLTTRTVFYSWYHWDAPRYLTIASQGYIDKSYVGFFPLYPTLVHTISILLHRDILLIGIIIANVSFFAALVILYRLVEHEFERETALRCVLYISIFPTALLFFDAYNTSLLLFLVVLCFYLLRRSHWWTAGFVGLLAALTDLIGVFLFIVFIAEFLRQFIASPPRTSQTSRALALTPLLAALLIPLGLRIYSTVLAAKTLDALAFLRPQSGSSISSPWTTLTSLFKYASGSSLYTFAGAHSVFELLLLLLLLATLILAVIGPLHFRRDQWPFALFGVLLLLSVLTFPSLPGGTQNPYDPISALLPTSLVFFPAFIILARLGKGAWFHTSYLLFSLPLLAFLLFQLFTGHWMV